jgi:hypothetical protein
VYDVHSVHITLILMILDSLNVLCAATGSGFVFMCIPRIISEGVLGTWLFKMLMNKEECSKFETSTVNNLAYFFVNVHLSIFFYSPIMAC